ncbi:hypothetical protein [Herbaspirillum sp. ST 5-3]|uniref:hypothetical protein n=1 Tax=Oxalobacteraceae TaxID=75682 RepID=UPI0010A4B3B8|nr:hypothetical protein [Herbaspirillum sp. ST 5-3]
MAIQFREHRGNSLAIVCVVITLGIVLRLWAALRGHNFDVDSYRIVADIVAAGGNVYAETRRYNYGPIWFHILHYLDVIPWPGVDALTSLRIKVAEFLTVVDLCIYFFLLRRYSNAVAALFFLNPISVLITGYHSQFDNLAVLLALIAVADYHEEKGVGVRLSCLIGIGLSLSVKHLLFVFPLWMAFRERIWSRRLFVLLVPYLVFMSGFVFYLPQGLQGIISNVFLYKSFDNAPFWAIFAPSVVFNAFPKIDLFISALALLGIWARQKSPLESLHLYLISLVTFSSAIANQYLSIPTASIAVFWNWAYALYSLVGGLYLTVEGNGLHLEYVRNLLHWNGSTGYHWLIFLLAIGLLFTVLGKQRAGTYFRNCVGFMRSRIQEARVQINAPW